MSTHSSIHAWRIPWTEGSVGLWSMGSQHVRQNWATERAHDTEKHSVTQSIASQITNQCPQHHVSSMFYGFSSQAHCKPRCSPTLWRQIPRLPLFLLTSPLPTQWVLIISYLITSPAGKLSWNWKWKCELLSCVQLITTPGTITHQTPLSMGLSRQECQSGLPSLLQEVFPTQGLNPGLLYNRQILCHLSHQGRLNVVKVLC